MKLNEGLWYYIVSKSGTGLGEWEYILLTVGFALAAMIAGYLLGSINSAVIISKVFYGDDIRNHGSGNAGMTNMLRTYGTRAAVLTLLGDMLKTLLAILVAALLFGFHYNYAISLDDGFCYVAGLFAVLGHVFPIFYGFKGGKGVLVTSTMALILTPIPFLLLLAIFIATVGASKYVSLGSVTVAVLYPVVVNAYIKFIFQAQAPGILSLCTVILAIFIVWCHRENLKRISNRTESKISFGKKREDDE